MTSPRFRIQGGGGPERDTQTNEQTEILGFNIGCSFQGLLLQPTHQHWLPEALSDKDAQIDGHNYH